MKYALYDYLTDKGINDFKVWTKKLQKPQRAKLNAKLDMLERNGSDLFPHILTGTDTPGIQKLRVSGNIQLRPMLCKGPVNLEKEFTLLFGAIEVQDKLKPKNADQIANTRKKMLSETKLGELNMKEFVKTLTTEFGDKEYAHAYVEDFSNMFIAAQIKALRDQKGWTQKELADNSGMKQERISALEDVNYEAWTAKTLRKLAHAFDLTLKISFEKFSDCISDIDAISTENLRRISREEDLSQFKENDFINPAEIRSGFQEKDTVTRSTTTNVIDIKYADISRGSAFYSIGDSENPYLEFATS